MRIVSAFLLKPLLKIFVLVWYQDYLEWERKLPERKEDCCDKSKSERISGSKSQIPIIIIFIPFLGFIYLFEWQVTQNEDQNRRERVPLANGSLPKCP